MAASSASKQFCQLVRMRRAVKCISTSKRLLTTTHAIPLLNAGCDLEKPDILYGSRSWRWLRPASPLEVDHDDWHQYKSRISTFYITVNSDGEIREDIWRQMLQHLNNQMPSLRMVILPHNKEKWICHIEDMDFSLKMYENVEPLDIFDKLIDEFVNKSPFVCMVNKTNQDGVSLFPEDARSKPYQYYFTFFAHHGLNDGYSAALMIRYTIDILNQLLAGKNVEDTIPLCHASTGDEILTKKAKLRETLIRNQTQFDFEKGRLLNTIKLPLIHEAFPAPNVPIVKSGNIFRTADNLIFSAFQKQCKSSGVTLSSGLMAVINAAIVEKVREAGILEKSYKITVSTIVDFRRYMNNHPQSATGNLVGGMHQSMHPNENILRERDFWEHARIINDNTRNLLKKDGALVESVLREMILPKVNPHEIFNSSNMFKYKFDYTFNNLMDITPILYDEKKHKHVVITKSHLMNSPHNFHPLLFCLNTYRGITQFTLSYANNYISHETAEEIMDRIVFLIRDKSQFKY